MSLEGMQAEVEKLRNLKRRPGAVAAPVLGAMAEREWTQDEWNQWLGEEYAQGAEEQPVPGGELNAVGKGKGKAGKFGKGGYGKGGYGKKGKEGSKGSPGQPRAPPGGKNNGGWVETRICHNCDTKGHLARDCPQPNKVRASAMTAPGGGDTGSGWRTVDTQSGQRLAFTRAKTQPFRICYIRERPTETHNRYEGLSKEEVVNNTGGTEEESRMPPTDARCPGALEKAKQAVAKAKRSTVIDPDHAVLKEQEEAEFPSLSHEMPVVKRVKREPMGKFRHRRQRERKSLAAAAATIRKDKAAV